MQPGEMAMADESNRTPPRTQAALPEAMQERQATGGGVSRRLHPSYFVMATKTATGTDCTHPVPEAQQDRFMFDIDLAALDQADEEAVVKGDPAARLPQVTPIIGGKRLEALQRYVRTLELPEEVKRAIVAITGAESSCRQRFGRSHRQRRHHRSYLKL